MKIFKNILLTLLAAAMLVGFGWAVTSPTITEEAFNAHMDLENGFEEEGVDDAYDFL